MNWSLNIFQLFALLLIGCVILPPASAYEGEGQNTAINLLPNASFESNITGRDYQDVVSTTSQTDIDPQRSLIDYDAFDVKGKK